MNQLSFAAPEAPEASAALAARVRREAVRWYSVNARDLPWRRTDCTPWGVLVSEFMLQQTPVTRVLPVWREWMARYPEPADLAAAASGEAVKAWGRLGYPRRALRLHRAAIVITREHGGHVPPDFDALLALPGVGKYTAGAVASFAFHRSHTVLDTNIRRVLGRVFSGRPEAPAAPSAAEYALAARLLPRAGDAAARWNVAAMELGALVCTARSPRCDDCPLRRDCAWVRAGKPAATAPARPAQAWHGTDRQLRGAIMAVLRVDGAPVGLERFYGAAPGANEGANEGANGALAARGASAEPDIPQADALARLRELQPDDDRLAHLIDDLCADGLAELAGGHLTLPR